jgi:glucuronate isomerase
MANNFIFNDDFLLQTKLAKELYHDDIKSLPIIDYHNHLDVSAIANDYQFKSITELWLKGDHYKWRAMRAMGINEELISGDANDQEKFIAWASILPATLRNPLFHWSHLELKNTFGIDTYINASNAKDIYTHCNLLLKNASFSTKSLLKKANVKMLATTDDPCDSLNSHLTIKNNPFGTDVRPSFRPDTVINIEDASHRSYISKLALVTQCPIDSIDSLLNALENRVDYFNSLGCTIADFGLETLPADFSWNIELELEFKNYLKNETSTFSNPQAFATKILFELCKLYQKHNWIQQFHLGAIRNNNYKIFTSNGKDMGVDSIGDASHVNNIAVFFSKLDAENALAKSIIYNNNPSDNEAFASMAGNFFGEGIKAKVQFGAAWWFLDTLDGMQKHLNSLSNIGLVSTFVGMLTDSRSFLSFTRHEYFRRLICNLFASDVEAGLLPNDKKWIASILKDICYKNAKNYFDV